MWDGGRVPTGVSANLEPYRCERSDFFGQCERQRERIRRPMTSESLCRALMLTPKDVPACNQGHGPREPPRKVRPSSILRLAACG